MRQNVITVTKAMLNTPPFIKRSFTVALMITNNSSFVIKNLLLTDNICKCIHKNGYRFDNKTAVMFYKGKKYFLEATAYKNKITLKGISIPPRESVFIFYSLVFT